MRFFVIGSGLVGLVAAHSLSSLNFRVVLVDKKIFQILNYLIKTTELWRYQKGLNNFGTFRFVRNHLKQYAEPYKKIRVFDRSPNIKIEFQNSISNQNLGYVIENKKFSKVLIDKLNKFKKTKTIYDFDVANLQFENGTCRLAQKRLQLLQNY